MDPDGRDARAFPQRRERRAHRLDRGRVFIAAPRVPKRVERGRERDDRWLNGVEAGLPDCGDPRDRGTGSEDREGEQRAEPDASA